MPSVLPSPLPEPSCLPDVIHLYSSATMSNTSVLLWPGCTGDGWQHACKTFTDTLNQAMLLCFLVVACFWMAVGHVRVDEWMLRMCLCAALLGWFWYNVLTKYVESHRNSHKTALKCEYACLCLWSTVFTPTSPNSNPHTLLCRFPLSLLPFSKQDTKAHGNVHGQRSSQTRPRPPLFSPPSHSSHLCWGLAGRKI